MVKCGFASDLGEARYGFHMLRHAAASMTFEATATSLKVLKPIAMRWRRLRPPSGRRSSVHVNAVPGVKAVIVPVVAGGIKPIVVGTS